MTYTGKSTIEVRPVNGERARDQLEHLADGELDRFEEWFTTAFPGNQPLAKYERAILKTFLMFRLEENAATSV